MRASSGFLSGRTLSARARCCSQLRPAVATAFPAQRGAAVFAFTRRRCSDRLMGVVGSSTSTSSTFSPSLPPPPRARGPARLTSSATEAAAATGGDPSRDSNAESPPSSSSSSSPSSPLPSLVLYSRRNCPLCQGLEEKVRSALARGAFLPGSRLRGVILEIRSIEENEVWEAAFATEVPVLFWREGETGEGGKEGGGGGGGGGKETPIPRSPPRVTVEKLSSTLEAAMP